MRYAFIFALFSTVAFASTIQLNVASAQISNAQAAGFQTRYKLDNTNWDMMLGNGQAVSAANITTANLGNVPSLSGDNWLYEVSNVAGQGMYFKMTDVTSQASRLLAWGSFQPNVLPTATTSSTVATLNSVAPSPFYNALHLLASSTVPGSASFSNASFTVSTAGINVNGIFPSSGNASNPSPSTKQDVYIAYTDGAGNALDLGTVNWAFSTNVQLTRTSGSSEGVKLEWTGKTLDYAPVPEPATMGMTGAAILIVGLIARSRFIQRIRVNA